MKSSFSIKDWEKIRTQNSQVLASMKEESGKLTLTLTKRKTVKFSNFISWAHFLQAFRLVSTSVKSPAQRTCMERQESSFEAGAPRYPGNDLLCFSFSPVFGEDTFGLTISF